MEVVVAPVFHRYVKPPEAKSESVVFWHIVSVPVMVAITLPTVTTTVVESVQPEPFVPNTVYVVLDGGFTLVVAQVGQATPVTGAQL